MTPVGDPPRVYPPLSADPRPTATADPWLGVVAVGRQKSERFESTLDQTRSLSALMT